MLGNGVWLVATCLLLGREQSATGMVFSIPFCTSIVRKLLLIVFLCFFLLCLKEGSVIGGK